MSVLGEAVLRGIQRRRAPPVTEQSASHDDDWAAYIRWQFDSSGPLFGKYPGFDVRGRRVLEIGCGTGGRAAYLASLGAREVVAIDINEPEIDIAKQWVPRLYPEWGAKVDYRATAEGAALDLGTFDVVVLVDTLEHLVSPPQVMRLAYDYTAPGGRCFAGLIGWYHAWGSHTRLMPFVNVFFSDETILNVIREAVNRPDYQPSRFDSQPPIERWRGLYDLRQRPGEYLNKITLAEMKKLVRHSIFPSARMHVIGFGGGHSVLRLLNPLRRVPGLQEVLHSYVVLEFQR